MNFSDYEKTGKAKYEELAQVMREMLSGAWQKRNDLPRLQAVQARSKGISNLRKKLEKREILEANDVEARIKDLAGIRVVLYTNIDVDRFLQTRLIPELFEVQWEETKAHYPNAENDGIKYEGFHYIVSLTTAMTDMPKYAHLKGLRCEIQIQTLLAHAFAESSHDIIYKDEETPGFGTKKLEEMRDRLNKVADDMLKPAGYELDKVQADSENLRRGRELFNRSALETLLASANNNERYERLSEINDYLIPHFDDISAVAKEINRTLVKVVQVARATEVVEREIAGMKIAGRSTEDVARLVVQTIADLRYADVEASLDTFLTLYKGETSRDIRQQIIESVTKLAGYNLHAWKQVGPGIQLYLADRLDKMPTEEIESVRPLAIAIWRELLGWDMDGTTWSANAVQISKGAVPSDANIKDMRRRAIDGLTGMLDRSANDDARRPVISAFWEASQLPMQANYSNETLKTALEELKVITEVLLPRLPQMQFDLWQSIESHLYREYRRFNGLATSKDDKMGVKASAQALVDGIKSVRQKMNRTQRYVRFKTLVGFEGVFSQQWDNEAFGYVEVEALRKQKAAKYVTEITPDNSAKWIGFIKDCAATKSNDWATFPIFSEFLLLLGEKKPNIAFKAIATGDEGVLNFLPSLLAGLSKSADQKGYKTLVGEYTVAGKHLAEITRQYRFSDMVRVADIREVLLSAIKARDELAITECLVCAIAKWPALGADIIGGIFLPAIEFLTCKKNCNWVRGAWFMPTCRDFFAHLTEPQTGLVLENLGCAKKIDHQYERILMCIGLAYPGLVWRYFRDRLLRKDDGADADFDAIPYQLYDLPKVMGKVPEVAVQELRSWFKSGDNMFQFTGGRLLHAVFPTCTKELAEAAMKVAGACGDEDIDFLLNCFRPYRGEETLHPVAKMLVRAMREDDRRLGSVEILLENTGVVSGEYGMAEAMRERKKLMEGWLEDSDARIRAFAERCIKHLDNRIATETRDADNRKERRKRDYGE